MNSAVTLTAAPAKLSWLAYGDLRGYLEPCGCDPRTDLGGLRRLGTLLRRERALNPSLWVFDLGNDLSPFENGHDLTATLKIPFLVEGIARLQPLAVLFNQIEFKRAAALASLKNEAIKVANSPKPAFPPYVVSNAKAGSEATKIASSEVLHPDGIVFGYVYADSLVQDVEPATTPTLLESWRKTLATRAQHRTKVLLFSGPEAHLQVILNSRLFDLIISSNSEPVTVQPGTQERDYPGRLLRTTFENHEVWMVPLGGQGVVRGGEARNHEAKPLAELVGSPFQGDCKIFNGECGSVVGGLPKPSPNKTLAAQKSSFVSWLDLAQGDDESLSDLFERYARSSTDQFKVRAAARKKDLATSPYAGSNACASCHPAAFKVWQSSKHSLAYKTLQSKSKETDPECVTCHVLGATAVGGFVDHGSSPGFAGVQCENCHGPRKSHIKNPTEKSSIKSRDVCVSCHFNPHSSAFVFDEYWPRIQHQ